MEWAGLNKPIEIRSKDFDKRRTRASEEESREQRPRRMDPSQRGWSGTTWPGRHAGPPQLPNGGIQLMLQIMTERIRIF